MGYILEELGLLLFNLLSDVGVFMSQLFVLSLQSVGLVVQKVERVILCFHLKLHGFKQYFHFLNVFHWGLIVVGRRIVDFRVLDSEFTMVRQ